VLRRIAIRGWDEFYTGAVAEEIVSELQRIGLDIGLDDLLEHEGFETKPLKLNMDSPEIFEIPPNSQGTSTLYIVSALYEEELYKI